MLSTRKRQADHRPRIFQNLSVRLREQIVQSLKLDFFLYAWPWHGSEAIKKG